jgi:hypothetical protein
MSRGFCGHGVAGVVTHRVAGGVADYPLLGLLPVVLFGVGAVVDCWHILCSSAVMGATCFSSLWMWFVLAAWVESIAFSMCSNWSESYSII